MDSQRKRLIGSRHLDKRVFVKYVQQSVAKMEKEKQKAKNEKRERGIERRRERQRETEK